MATYEVRLCDMGMGPCRRMWPDLAAFDGKKRQRIDATRRLLQGAIWEYFDGVSRRDTQQAWDCMNAAKALSGVRRGYVFEIKTAEVTFCVYRLD